MQLNNNIFNPFGTDVSDDQLKHWINQFEENEIPYIIPLLKHFRYYNLDHVFELLNILYLKMINELNISIKESYFVPYGYVAKSGSAIAYFFRRKNNLPLNCFIAAQDLNSISLKNINYIIIIDDFIGSGYDAVKLWKQYLINIRDLNENCRFIYACMVGYQSGIDYIKSNTDFEIVVSEVINYTEQPFNDQSIIYNDLQKSEAKRILLKYGDKLSPKFPLGYGNTQALVGFFFSTPNNTLPIFWSSTEGWVNILPHGESFRDPNFLLGPPEGLPIESISSDPRRPVVEIEKLDQFDVSSETAIKLLTEFHSTSVFLIFAPIIKNLNLDDNIVSGILALKRKLENATHEKEPICASLLISNKFQEAKNIVTYTCADPNISLFDLKKVEALIQLAHGLEGALLFDKSGKVIGNLLFKSSENKHDIFLPKRYWAMADSSKEMEALLLFFNGNGKISIFYKGIRILSYRNASWHIHSSTMDRAILRLASLNSLPQKIIASALRVAFEMSDLGYGGLITIGDYETVLTYSTSASKSLLSKIDCSILDEDLRAFISLAKQDGATILAESGDIKSVMAFLRPPVDVEAEQEVGKGSRHDTAAKISALTKALVIAVSVDGRISTYSKGNLIFKLMG